ncbi:signal peptidase II [Candidatus Gracilibacteria bacterium]|nr:MAG: signal peptidase II [Candidatus Gracilibacteria bacterium]
MYGTIAFEASESSSQGLFKITLNFSIMRKFVIIISIIILIAIDAISKWFFHGVFQAMVFGCPYTGTSSISCVSVADERILYQYFPLLSDIFGIQLSYNTGVAFSFHIPGFFLKILTLVLVIAIGVYFVFTEYPKKSKLLDIGYVCILAGALSHTYERIFHGYVIDFFSLKYFAIFNFADIIISIGVIFILFYYFFYDRSDTATKSK